MTGILALQGGYDAHGKMVRALGSECLPVRTREELSSVDRLILPGGESSVMTKLMERSGLLEDLVDRIHKGMPVFGTCAGLILLSDSVEQSGSEYPGGLDICVRRNAYGRQVDSFETDLIWEKGSFTALFIRAPKILSAGEGVQILSSYEGSPVLVRQNNCLAASFHPELTGYDRIHRYFLEEFGI